MKVLKFEQGNWDKIAGRGWVYATRCPEDFSREPDPWALFSKVEIEGFEYDVIGIETMGKNSFRKYGLIAFNVRGEKKP